MNLLFLTEISTFPVKGGEKLRSYGLIKMLSNLGHNVTAIINRSTNIEKINNVEFILFDFNKYNVGRQIKRDINNFTINKDLIQLIDSVLSKQEYQFAILDYKFQGQYISYFKKRGIRVIYGTHNAEAKLNYQRPIFSLRNYISHTKTYFMESFHEKLFFPRADALMVVSENDRGFYKKFIPAHKIHYIPNMLDEKEYIPYEGEKENYIIMSGNFTAFQNRVGIDWFIKNIWDKTLWEKTKLMLAGLYSIETLEILKEKYSFQNVEAVGMVDDIKSLIKKAKASVVPLLDGGGTRLKCIEAMALKTQLISTAKGAEGIDHNDSILIADDPGRFKECILDVLEERTDHTGAAREIFLNEYSFLANEKKIQKMIDGCCNQ